MTHNRHRSFKEEQSHEIMIRLGIDDADFQFLGMVADMDAPLEQKKEMLGMTKQEKIDKIQQAYETRLKIDKYKALIENAQEQMKFYKDWGMPKIVDSLREIIVLFREAVDILEAP